MQDGVDIICTIDYRPFVKCQLFHGDIQQKILVKSYHAIWRVVVGSYGRYSLTKRFDKFIFN